MSNYSAPVRPSSPITLRQLDAIGEAPVKRHRRFWQHVRDPINPSCHFLALDRITNVYCRSWNPSSIETRFNEITEVVAEHESMLTDSSWKPELDAAMSRIHLLERRLAAVEAQRSNVDVSSPMEAPRTASPSGRTASPSSRRVSRAFVGLDSDENPSSTTVSQMRKSIVMTQNRDSLRMAQETERLHQVEHSVHQLTVALNRLQAMSGNAPTRSDLSTIRNEAREMWSKASDMVEAKVGVKSREHTLVYAQCTDPPISPHRRPSKARKLWTHRFKRILGS